MRDVVLFQQGRQDLACADRVRFEGNEDEYGCGLWMVASEEIVVELSYQSSREVHGDEDRVEEVVVVFTPVCDCGHSSIYRLLCAVGRHDQDPTQSKKSAARSRRDMKLYLGQL